MGNAHRANWVIAASVASDNWSTVASPIGTPGAVVNPGSLNFGNQTVNTTSTVKNAVITNTGTGNLVIYNIGTTGTDSADFSFTSSALPITVTPQSRTTIGVQFKPPSLGNQTGSMYIYDNTSVGTLAVNLTGSGVSPSTTSLSSSVNPALFGQSIVFTAVVSCSSSVAPTGTVTFKKANEVLGPGTLNTAATATFTTSTLPVGCQ